jgi:Arc/MetJ family transcription regulator
MLSLHIEVSAVRTNIDIDDELMQQAMKATGAKTKRSAIEMALRTLVEVKVHDRKVDEVFRLQETERKKAEQEGRLDGWHAELVKTGNWPETTSDANERRD